MAKYAATYSLPETLLQQLTAEARKQGRPLSWLVRDALIAYLPRTDTSKTAKSSGTEVSPDGGA